MRMRERFNKRLGWIRRPTLPIARKWPTWIDKGVVLAPNWLAKPYIISDPDVHREGDNLVMLVTGVKSYGGDPEVWKTEVYKYTSTDNGASWTLTDTPVVASKDDASWDERSETAHYYAGTTYYVGYTDEAAAAGVFPASIGASGTAYMDPAFDAATTAKADSALYSPTILNVEGTLHMIYTGVDWNTAPNHNILGATSTNGTAWTPHSAVVLAPNSSYSWMSTGVSEATMVKAGGKYWLFFTGMKTDGADEYRAIGQAYAAHPFGPYTVMKEEPIITASNSETHHSLGPCVIYEGGVFRMWYIYLVAADSNYQIHYAEGTL